ncbi:MAG: hypothetical protein V4659_04280 [Pseudomonadota bacterium]
MGETDDTIASARNSLARVRGVNLPAPRTGQRKRGDTPAFRLAAIALVNAIILVAAGVVGFVLPLGLFGALAVLLLMVAVTCAIAFAPVVGGRAPSLEKLREAPVALLPAQTARWLDAQRPALPAPAITLADRIGLKLATLTPQLATLNDSEPAAAEIRKLVGEQLPDFVKGYAAVPPTLRTTPRNGKTPDAQLIDGLKVIDDQLGELSAQLAQGDLDNLSTRGRFLEIRYKGDTPEG